MTELILISQKCLSILTQIYTNRLRQFQQRNENSRKWQKIIRLQSLFEWARSHWLYWSGSKLVENSAFWNSYKVWSNYKYSEHSQSCFCFQYKHMKFSLRKHQLMDYSQEAYWITARGGREWDVYKFKIVMMVCLRGLLAEFRKQENSGWSASSSRSSGTAHCVGSR